MDYLPPPAVVRPILHVYRIEFIWREVEYVLDLPGQSISDVWAAIETQFPGCKIHWCRIIG